MLVGQRLRMTITTTIAITTTAAATTADVMFNGDMGRDDRIREVEWNILRACLYGKEG